MDNNPLIEKNNMDGAFAHLYLTRNFKKDIICAEKFAKLNNFVFQYGDSCLKLKLKHVNKNNRYYLYYDYINDQTGMVFYLIEKTQFICIPYNRIIFEYKIGKYDIHIDLINVFETKCCEYSKHLT